jgi:hypothetical protein
MTVEEGKKISELVERIEKYNQTIEWLNKLLSTLESGNGTHVSLRCWEKIIKLSVGEPTITVHIDTDIGIDFVRQAIIRHTERRDQLEVKLSSMGGQKKTKKS